MRCPTNLKFLRHSDFIQIVGLGQMDICPIQVCFGRNNVRSLLVLRAVQRPACSVCYFGDLNANFNCTNNMEKNLVRENNRASLLNRLAVHMDING